MFKQMSFMLEKELKMTFPAQASPKTQGVVPERGTSLWGKKVGRRVYLFSFSLHTG